MNKKEMLKQGNYMTVIKPLAHAIGISETLLLMELVGMEESKEKKYNDSLEFAKKYNVVIKPEDICFYPDDKGFMCTELEIEIQTALTQSQQKTLFKKLENRKLLKRERRGNPGRRFVILNMESIVKLFVESMDNFETYKNELWKKRTEETKTEMKKRKERQTLAAVESGENEPSSRKENDRQDGLKSPGFNNTALKNTDYKNNKDLKEIIEEEEKTINSATIDFLENELKYDDYQITGIKVQMNAAGTTYLTKEEMTQQHRFMVQKLEKGDIIYDWAHYFVTGIMKQRTGTRIKSNQKARAKVAEAIKKQQKASQTVSVPFFNWLEQ